jgi:succinyl-diaminopimelate desuccinylase
MDIMKSGCADDINEIFICEPSNEKIGICEKGALWVKINTYGKQSHGSMPHLGVNAIEKTYELIERIKNECIDLNKENPHLGKNTVSVTGFNGGIKTNIIPPEAGAVLDIRTIPGSSHDKIIKDIYKIADDIVSSNKNLKFEFEITNNRPPLEADEDSPFINIIKDVYKKLNYSTAYKGIYFYTDASKLIPKINVPFVILGPGETSMAHQMDEKIEVESIGRTAKIYINYILQQ